MLVYLILAASLLSPSPAQRNFGPGPGPGPGQQAPATDTVRLIPGLQGQQFGWGTAVLRNGQTLRAYLPATASGLDQLVYYYLAPPDAVPSRRPKLLAVSEVRWMRVRGQYSELLTPDKREPGRLAARRATGSIDLFMVQAAPVALVGFLGPTPVLSSPASGSISPGAATWYLRRPGGPPVLVRPESFASQLAEWLAPNAELARRVAAGQAGYRFEDLESIVRQFNQRGK